MTKRKPVGVIRQPSNSGSRDEDGLEFIRCVGGQDPHGSVERIDVPAPSCGTGVAWTENILVPDSRWGDGGSYKTWASTICSRPLAASMLLRSMLELSMLQTSMLY